MSITETLPSGWYLHRWPTGCLCLQNTKHSTALLAGSVKLQGGLSFLINQMDFLSQLWQEVLLAGWRSAALVADQHRRNEERRDAALFLIYLIEKQSKNQWADKNGLRSSLSDTKTVSDVSWFRIQTHLRLRQTAQSLFTKIKAGQRAPRLSCGRCSDPLWRTPSLSRKHDFLPELITRFILKLLQNKTDPSTLDGLRSTSHRWLYR